MRSLLENLKLRPWSIDLATARSMPPGRGLRFSCKDRTDEVIKLFIIWLFLQEKKTFLLKRKLAFDIRWCARLPIHSPIQSHCRSNIYRRTQWSNASSELSKSIFIIVKKRLQQSCRKLFIIVCPNLKRTWRILLKDLGSRRQRKRKSTSKCFAYGLFRNEITTENWEGTV